MIVCWFDDLMWNCCYVCDFYFFLQQNDVSTFKQENNYCKNHLMNELINSKKHENRLLIECRLISTNKKIDYWLSFSQIHDHFRWFTIRIMKYIHRFQKENFTFWRFSFDSRIFTNDSTIFFWTFAYFYERWKHCFYSFFLRTIDDFF